MPSTEPIRVGVLGAGGRMGATVCAAVDAAPGLELVAAIDPGHPGLPAAGGIGPAASTLEIASERDELLRAGAGVVVDFTVAEAAVENLEFAAANGIHAVCGTTGLSVTDLEHLTAAFSAPAGPNCILAPNFAISAVLMMRFAELAAPYFDNAEIIELHHENKRDAPSGTALTTAARIDEARLGAGVGPFGADPTTEVKLAGARGGRSTGGVHLHAVRLAGLVAHQEVLFGTEGQSLTIRQDSYERTSFMPGVLLAIRKIADTPGFTVGLEALLDL